jgi:hypothetical protein
MIGAAAKQPRFRKASISAPKPAFGGFDDENSESSRPSQTAFLQLERLYPHYNFNSFVYLHSVAPLPETEDTNVPTIDVLDDYLAFFNTAITDADLRIELPFLLRYKDSTVAPASIYSVSLEFKPTGNKLIYGSTSQTVNIPILSSTAAETPAPYGKITITEEMSSKLSDNVLRGEFPSRYSFVLDLGISVPLPTFFLTKATFNSEDGHVGEIDLDPLPLTLKDMFLPVMAARIKRPLPAGFEGLHPNVYASALFESMWLAIHNESEEMEQTRRISEKQRAEFASAVKYLERPSARVITALQARLAPFLLDKIVPDAKLPQTVRAFIFLSKSYHLLLKFKIEENYTSVAIATDFWRVLGFVDPFFDELLPRHSI